MAAATGAGGELGRQLWSALRGLVKTGPATGEAELVALSEAPHDVERARALSEALSRRAEQDTSFRTHLTQWQQQAQLLRTGDGDTHNAISGGTQNGPVVQGRDFSGITFSSPPSRDR
ncbi:hypothetical protein [Streptomyces canus]|uniref:hypothetical protein n=1 Tax=Streptomyces canus TaxID=58343 RepID=UPI0036E111A8